MHEESSVSGTKAVCFSGLRIHAFGILCPNEMSWNPDISQVLRILGWDRHSPALKPFPDPAFCPVGEWPSRRAWPSSPIAVSGGHHGGHSKQQLKSLACWWLPGSPCVRSACRAVRRASSYLALCFRRSGAGSETQRLKGPIASNRQA